MPLPFCYRCLVFFFPFNVGFTTRRLLDLPLRHPLRRSIRLRRCRPRSVKAVAPVAELSSQDRQSIRGERNVPRFRRVVRDMAADALQSGAHATAAMLDVAPHSKLSRSCVKTPNSGGSPLITGTQHHCKSDIVGPVVVVLVFCKDQLECTIPLSK